MSSDEDLKFDHHDLSGNDSDSPPPSSSSSSSSSATIPTTDPFPTAKQAYDAKNYEEALELFRQSATFGNKEACMYLGLMHRYGFGVRQNFATALDWYKEAAPSFPDDCQAQIVFLEKRLKQQANSMPQIDIEVTGSRKHANPGAKHYVEYIVTVSSNGATWEIRKRYRLFENFHKTLEATFGLAATQPLGFPPKKWIGGMDPEFISKRRQQLQEYLQRIVKRPEIVNSTAFLNFISYHENTQ